MEQLEHQPGRRPLLGRLIAKALFAAAHASELGVAINYPQPRQLFSAALLFSFADLVIAYQTPDLFQALTAARTPDDETKILGVSRARFATALAQTWVLPAGLMDLIGTQTPTAKTRCRPISSCLWDLWQARTSWSPPWLIHLILAPPTLFVAPANEVPPCPNTPYRTP